MRTNFTPGPWQIKRSGCIVDRESGHLVATTGYRVAVHSPEDDANAALIADAPEMYALLKRMVEADSKGALDDAMFREASALLARHEGEGK